MTEVSVRPARGEDHPSIDAVEAEAFGGHARVVAPLIHELRRTGAGVVELVATVDDEIVGHVQVSRGWLDAPTRLVEVHILSPLAVAPARQSLGIGRLLIAEAVAVSGASVPAMFLEGDPSYYSRSGFEAAGPLGFRSPSVRIPEPAFQVRLLPAYRPWMTGTLVYPEAFWALDAVGLR